MLFMEIYRHHKENKILKIGMPSNDISPTQIGKQSMSNAEETLKGASNVCRDIRSNQCMLVVVLQLGMVIYANKNKENRSIFL